MTDYVTATISGMGEQWQPLARKVISDCLNPPNGWESFIPRELERIAFMISKAIQDCEALDSWGGDDYFSTRFMKAIDDPRAFAGLAWEMDQEPDKKKTRPLAEALKEGVEEFQAARLLNSIREMVRDGIPPQETLSRHSMQLEEIARLKCGWRFFTLTLPKALRDIEERPERYTRPLIGWIRRAWVPLALWVDLANPQAVHDVLDLARCTYPPTRNLPFEYEAHFLPAWSKVKPRRSRRLPD